LKYLAFQCGNAATQLAVSVNDKLLKLLIF